MSATPARNTTVRNTTWAELKVGDSASIERTCSVQDLILFAHVSGNLNPLMLPSENAGEANAEPLAPSMWVGSLVSAVLGNILPGPGTLYRAQDLRFLGRVHVGDRVTVTVVCREKREAPIAVFDTKIVNAVGQVVCTGTAEIEAPTVTQVVEARHLPSLIVDTADHFGALVIKAAKLPPLRTAVVCPDDRNSLSGALLSAERGLIEPILIGDPERIKAAAKALDADISRFSIESIADPQLAAARAVAMVLEGKVGAVMKGDLHSDILLAEVVKKDGGLRTSRRISHVFALDVPDARRDPLHLRRRDQHRAGPHDQGRHRPERRRPRPRLRPPAAARRHPVGGRDHQPGDRLDARRRHLVEDGRTRPDPRRDRRRAAGDGQRHRPRGGAHQGHHLAGRGTRQRADRSQSRSRATCSPRSSPSSRGRKRRGWCWGRRFRSC